MLIPIGDENPTRRRPLVNWTLIALNGAAFIALNLVRGRSLMPSGADLDRFGLLPGEPTPLGFLTSMFVHANALHLLGNMWFLHIFGDNVEDKLGRVRYLLFYLVCGAAATGAFLVFGRPFGNLIGSQIEAWKMTPLVGASGAIAGVMGAYIVFFPRARIRMLVWILFVWTFFMPAFLVIGLKVLMDVLYFSATPAGQVGGTAHMAHIGGTLAGVAVALLVKPLLRGDADTAWDRDTGFARRRNGDGTAPADLGSTPAWEAPRVLPGRNLREQLSGAVLDHRMDLALELYDEWRGRARPEVLPAGVEIEIAHEIFRRGRIEDALEAYRHYLGSHPRAADAAEAKFRLGLIHARATLQPARAREWLLQAISEHPDPETVAYARRELAGLDR